MKKKKFIATLMAFTAASVLGLTACDGCKDDDKEDIVNPPPVVTPVDKINVGVTQVSVTIKDYEVADFNFARYFRITDDNTAVAAKEYVNSASVKAEAGEYEVTCTYKEKTATLKVVVEASQCEVTLSREAVSMNTAALKDYNFKALFSASVDGKKVEITDGMVTTDLKNEAGEYTYTVTCGSASKTLKITVIDEHAIEIINSYTEYEITKSELEDFDFTTLFSIFVGGIAEEVKEEYIDLSSLSSAEEGKSYDVIIHFEKNGRQAQSTVKLNVVAHTQITVNAKTVTTYPNGENIDLKTLFEVKRGNQTLTVTDDMISGTVDYSKEGDNIITLNYGGRLAYATVKVKLGVIIDYSSSDTVLVQKGTDIGDYDFGADFTVVINGIKFTNFDSSYFDLTGVDFGTVGEYKVKIKVPYNTKPLTFTGVDFDYFEKEITYEVVEKKVDYSIKVLQDTVILPSGTTKYNVFNNLNVVIDGIKRIPYDNLDYLGATTCYAEIKSDALDFDSPAEQYVEIDVFVYGPEFEPVTVGFTVRIDNGVEVNGSERVIFSGTTVYPKDLFTVTEKGQPIKVTNEMVTGKIDLFHAGIYFVTATYKGVSAQSKVVVLDREMTGTYKTLLTKIEAYEESDDDDYDYGWGDYDGDFDESGYSLSAPYNMSSYAAAATLAEVTVDDDGNIYFGNQKVEITSIVDDSTFEVNIRTYEFVMRYGDGILTFDPINSVKLSYHDDSRPMVFFNENKWTVENYVQINSSPSGYHVLQKNSAGNLLVFGGAYSLDIMQLTSKADGVKYWYGIKTQFLTKTSSDTYYADEIFDFAVFAPDFEQVKDNQSSVVFGGERYSFKMSDSVKGIISTDSQSVSPFAGMTFKGVIDGKDAAFAVNGADKVTLRVDGKTVFDITASDQSSLKNAGIDYVENTWLIYNKYNDKDNTPLSYRFRLDKEGKTFTLDERDDLFGRYVFEKACFFFDGYGTGEVWFDTDSKYLTTAFTYVRNGNNVEITYRNADPSFTHGKTAKLLFSDYKNVLTLREVENADNLIGQDFVNEVIEDGAIVKVSVFVLGKGSGKKELLDGLSIITKDGALSYSDKDNGVIAGTSVKYVDVSKIQFYRAGFYQLIVNIPVGGEIKSAYYSVQVLDNIYAGNKQVGKTSSVINSGASLSLDEYGRISGVFAGVSFSGRAHLKENTFTATAECKIGSMTISGEFVSDGIIKVTARGAVMFTDYFTTGSAKVCGNGDYTLRAITVGETTVYALANAPTSVGNIVQVEALTGNITTLGSILKISDGQRELIVKITEWGGTGKGLILSDSARGTYAKAGNEDLTLDGFGTVTLGAKTGTYTYYGRGVTVIFGSEMKVYNINTSDKTYEDSGKVIDVTLFAGKSFEATYYFGCEYDDGYSYRANTTFEFLADGKVVVKSSSTEHDEECSDKYNPEYATEAGMEGTFTVVGNKITVTVNGKIIEFTLTDAVGLGTITCSNTGISASSHGYFATGTVFNLV